jgi:nucleotide-binding universal stress UspA family protein
VSTDVIISYDGTANDDDALALGRLLAPNSTSVALAYIRHSPEFDPQREELARDNAERRLEQGAARLGSPDLPRHVVFSASTGAGLEDLAFSEGASLIVFGSDYRTQPGHAEPTTSAQRLLEVGGIGIAVAAAGLRDMPNVGIDSIAVPAVVEDESAKQTAEALAQKLGAKVLVAEAAHADLIVVGSQPGAPAGRVVLSGSARTMLDASRGSVLVVPSGKPLRL